MTLYIVANKCYIRFSGKTHTHTHTGFPVFLENIPRNFKTKKLFWEKFGHSLRQFLVLGQFLCQFSTKFSQCDTSSLF